MRKNRANSRKNIFFLALGCIAILIMSVGYSALQVILDISGVTKIRANWNIYVSGVTEAEVVDAKTEKTEVIERLKINFDSTIENQDGYIIYDVTVSNKGEMDAILKEIKGLESNEMVNCTVINTEVGDKYLANSDKTFQIKIQPNSSISDYPYGPINLNIELIFEKTNDGTGDITPPIGSPTILNAKTNAITIDSGCRDDESGIVSYQYRMNNGEWKTGSNIYTFNGLKSGTYSFEVQCINGMGLSSVFNNISGSTKNLIEPSITITPGTDTWSTNKKVLIVYDDSQDDFIYQYSLDNGASWNEVIDGNTKNLDFTNDGSIITKISDGTNEKITDEVIISKIDSGTPSAPLIVGGTTSWVHENLKIRILNESTSESGIKNYQYYISSSSENLVGGEWIDLESNGREFDISQAGEKYVYVRAVNNAGTYGLVSLPEKIMIDKVAPEIILENNENTTYQKQASIKVTINDYNSGLDTGIDIKYGFSTSLDVEPTTYTNVKIDYEQGDKSISFQADSTNLTGKYYLWVVPVTLKDCAGNELTDYVKSTGVFYLDNTKPTIQVKEDSKTETSRKLLLTVEDSEGIDFIQLPDGTVKSVGGNKTFSMDYSVNTEGNFIFKAVDLAGNEDSITYSAVFKGSVTLDRLSIKSPSSGTYKAGEEITFNATFSENVYSSMNGSVITSETAIPLYIKFGNEQRKNATFEKVDGNVITYKYTIQAGDNGYLNLSEYKGKIYDKDGLYSDVESSGLSGSNIIADTIGPSVSSISITNLSGTYSAGDVINIEVVYDENVYSNESGLTFLSTQAPVLDLKFDSNSVKSAQFESVSGNKMVYSYTISQDDNGTMILNSYKGVVYDIAGNNTNLNLTSITNSGNVIVVSNKTIENAVVGEIVTDYNKTIVGDKPKYNNPIIPVGFKPVETDSASWSVASGTDYPSGWDNGLVIEDTNQNQYVWIPVDGNTIKYAANYSYPNDYSSTPDNTADEAVPDGIISQEEQINKYEGYYLSRYEAGDPSASSKRTSSSSSSENPVSKSGKWPYTYLSRDEIKSLSERAGESEFIQSGLTTGSQWDTMCSWLNHSGKNVDSDSSGWGNYHKNLFSYSMQQTGSSDTYKANNLYDVAGNVWEFTAELNNNSTTPYIKRGGTYYYNVSGRYPAAYRMCIRETSIDVVDLSFRIVLYIK